MKTETINLDLFLDHLERIRGYKQKSLHKMRFLLTRVEEYLGKSLQEAKKSREIEEAVIRAAKERKTAVNGHKLDPNDDRYYRCRMGIAVAQYLRYLEAEREIDKNPYPRSTFRKPPKKEPDWLTDAQIAYIKNCANITMRDQVMFRVMLDTGCRRGEFINMRWTEINLSERLIHIPADITKTEIARTVPITQETRQWLEIYRPMAPGPYLTGEKLHTNTVGLRFEAISKIVGFRVHAHQIRHSAARIWVAAGVHVLDVQKFLGHQSQEQTAWYYHAEPTRLRMIQDSLNRPLTTESTTHNN